MENELTDVFNDSTAKAFIHENEVNVPLTFTQDFVTFSSKQARFLHYALKEKLAFTDAAIKAGMTQGQATRFLRSPTYTKWMLDQSKKSEVARYWSDPDNLIVEGDKLFKCRSELPPHVVRMWENMAARFFPARSISKSGDETQKVEITFSVDACKAALARSAAIDLEISKELGTGVV